MKKHNYFSILLLKITLIIGNKKTTCVMNKLVKVLSFIH